MEIKCQIMDTIVSRSISILFWKKKMFLTDFQQILGFGLIFTIITLSKKGAKTLETDG